MPSETRVAAKLLPLRCLPFLAELRALAAYYAAQRRGDFDHAPPSLSYVPAVVSNTLEDRHRDQSDLTRPLVLPLHQQKALSWYLGDERTAYVNLRVYRRTRCSVFELEAAHTDLGALAGTWPDRIELSYWSTPAARACMVWVNADPADVHTLDVHNELTLGVTP